MLACMEAPGSLLSGLSTVNSSGLVLHREVGRVTHLAMQHQSLEVRWALHATGQGHNKHGIVSCHRAAALRYAFALSTLQQRHTGPNASYP